MYQHTFFMSSKTVSIDLFLNLWHQFGSWEHIAIYIDSFNGFLECMLLTILIRIKKSACNFRNI